MSSGLSRDLNHEDSISSGFEPETPTSFFSHRIDGSQDESFDSNSLFGDESGRTVNVRTNNASSNQDEIPLIEDLPHRIYNPRLIEIIIYILIFLKLKIVLFLKKHNIG